MSVNNEALKEMIEFLPDEDKEAVFNIVKRLVLAWDRDYSKLTPAEAKRLNEAKADNDVVCHEDLLIELGI